MTKPRTTCPDCCGTGYSLPDSYLDPCGDEYVCRKCGGSGSLPVPWGKMKIVLFIFALLVILLLCAMLSFAFSADFSGIFEPLFRP